MIRESLISKQFIKKILQYDVETIEDVKRRNEISKLLGMMLVFFCKRKRTLKTFRLLPLTKKFLLTQISIIKDTKILINYLNCLHYMFYEPQIAVISLNERELTKFRTVECLCDLLTPENPQNIIWYSLRLLKILLKFNKK